MFRNKEYILAIIREGSFSRAAEKLYISQPSLSATVKRIEEKLTVPLFDRTTTPITLTEVGREYVRIAMEIDRRERDFERYINDRINLLVGEIKIGGSSLFSSFLLPNMISDFNAKYPRITIKILENNTKNLIRELSDGNLDIVIDNAVTDDDNIISSVYTTETLLLAVPADFEINEKLSSRALLSSDIKEGKHLSGEMSVELEEFDKLPFVLLHTENDTGKRAAALFRKHSITPNVLFRLDQQMTAYNISASGMGISFVSDTLVKNIDTSPALCYYRLSDPETTRNIYLYLKGNRYHSLACRKFIEYNTK